MNKAWVLTLACLFFAPVAWSGEEGGAVVAPPPTAENLKPFLAHYRETRNLGGNTHESKRMVHLQDATYPAGKGFRLVIAMQGRDTVYDEISILAKDFSPVTRVVSARSMLHRMEIYSGTKYQGVSLNGDGAQNTPVHAAVLGQRLPGGTDSLALATMDLKPGDQVVLPMYSSDMGDAGNLFYKVTVLGREKLHVADQSFDTWVIEKEALDQDQNPLKIQGHAFPKSKEWISQSPPYLVKTQSPMSNLELSHVHVIPGS